MSEINRINVTQTFLPKQQEYQKILSKPWDTGWMTNRGALVLELEAKIKEKFQISNMIATTNGTLPLQIAIKALGLTGEIITTPFSYIATASSIFWEGCTPVFVDINKETYNIDFKKIESAITPKTTAIIATHVFGNPCDIEAIETLANKHNLSVIYDAAHCFGVSYQDKSIFEYGDVSTCSFHATKIFHTGEGGALFTQDKTLYDKLFYHHNFGHDGPEHFQGLGINAKMSELQAAMGLAVLPHFDAILAKRKQLYKLYQELLGDYVQYQKINKDAEYNHAYLPVLFKDENEMQKVLNILNEHYIFPRRYFYPSLNTVAYFDAKEMKISEDIASRILCLPLYYDLKESDVRKISTILIKEIS